jgi:NADH-quinone oxidoreductase subunit M
MFDLGAHLLSWIIFLPAVVVGGLLGVEGVLRLFFATRLSGGIWKGAALSGSLVGFALSVLAWQRFDSTASGMQMVERAPWIPDYGIYYYVGIDGISLFLVILTTFLLPIVLLASWYEIATRVKQYVFFMLALQTGMLGAFLATNLFLFYMFWEVMLIPMYFVIGIWGGARRLYATLKFFIYTMIGSLLMLVGILVLYYLNYQQFGVLTFDYYGFQGAAGILDTVIATSGGPWWQTQTWLFAAFALAFAIKVPMFPFHTWLPDAHVEAPTAGSVVLAGVLLKLGTYGFLRYALPMFPIAALELSPVLFTLAAIGVIYGALVAMVQTDVKKLVAYSSVSHLGLVILGMFALNLQGIEGSILQMVNHGLSTGALFLLVGMIYERRHTREIAEFGGLARVMPVFTALFLITTFSSIGLPMLNGFVGEFLILIGVFGVSPWFAALGTSGVVLGAVYMLWMVRRVLFGPLLDAANQRLTDLTLREKVVGVAMVVPMIWIGVYPAPFLRPMDRAVEDFLTTMESRGADLSARRWRPEVAPAESAMESTERAPTFEPAELIDLTGGAAE